MRVFCKTLSPTATFALGYSAVGTIPARAVCLNTSIPPRSPAIRNRRQVPLLRLSRPQRQPRNRRRNPPSGPARSAAESNLRLVRRAVYALWYGGVLLLGALISPGRRAETGRYITARYGLCRAVFMSLLPACHRGVLASGFLLFARAPPFGGHCRAGDAGPDGKRWPEPSESLMRRRVLREEPTEAAEEPESTGSSDDDQIFPPGWRSGRGDRIRTAKTDTGNIKPIRSPL
jgi:hypothetical protein